MIESIKLSLYNFLYHMPLDDALLYGFVGIILVLGISSLFIKS